MTTYTAEIGAENIAFLTDTGSTIGCAGLLDHVASTDESPADIVVFDNAVARVLRELPNDYDGHFDGESIWIGGSPYPVHAASGESPTPATITSELIAAGVNSETITQTPDGVVTVTAADGSRFAVDEDGTDEGGTPWWTGTRYNAEDEIEGTDSWTSLAEMAAAVAAWAA